MRAVGGCVNLDSAALAVDTGDVCITRQIVGIKSKRLRIPVAPPLWMDVPSAEAPVFAGMTMVTHTSLLGTSRLFEFVRTAERRRQQILDREVPS